MADLDSLFLDKRPISSMAFGAEEKTPEAQAATAARVRDVLAVCDVAIADDINRLGCTGVLAKAKAVKEAAKQVFGDTDQHAATGVAKFLRLGLAGGGVGLPCFVPSTLYCIVHNTIGGLQDNQKALYPECVGMISRPLTDAERGQFELVNAVRKKTRNDPDEAADILSGREELPGMIERSAAEDGLDDDDVRVIEGLRMGAQTWKCDEHSGVATVANVSFASATNWSCRYCVAQAIVDGPLAVEFVLFADNPVGDAVYSPTGGDNVINALDACNEDGVDKLQLYARVATFTRKLSRD